MEDCLGVRTKRGGGGEKEPDLLSKTPSLKKKREGKQRSRFNGGPDSKRLGNGILQKKKNICGGEPLAGPTSSLGRDGKKGTVGED